MTSTSFNVGLRDGQRLSSRVLRPPGGGHTQLFGEAEELQNLKNQKDSFPETIAETQQEEQSVTEVNGASESGVKEDKIEQEALPVEELKAEQVVAPQAPLEAAPAAPAAAHAAEPAEPLQGMPRRARVPPGGYSSGLW